MDRRDLLKQCAVNLGSIVGAAICTSCSSHGRKKSAVEKGAPPAKSSKPSDMKNHKARVKPNTEPAYPTKHSHSKQVQKKNETAKESDTIVQSLLPKQFTRLDEQQRLKMKNFDRSHPGDIFISRSQKALLHSVSRKLSLVQSYVGFGKFNLLGFDDCRYFLKVGRGMTPFTRAEQKFIEEIFEFEAEDYGFYGDKIVTKLSERISDRDVIKIPHSGHYLFRDASLDVYRKITKDVGRSIVLTSGIRNVVKQLHLFLAKTIKVEGNFSQASRSLAPPGYSYHAVGDFDVGKKGFGTLNFTHKFSETDEYKRLIDLGYIDIRYPTDNPFGVRFEPWHIEGPARRV